MPRLPEPYPRHRTHVAIMGCGGKGKPERVIDRGHIRFYVGIGSGNTKEEAVASLIASLRRTADTIELAAKNTIPLRRTNGNGNTQG